MAKAWLESQPRTRIETDTPGYLHAKSLSLLFGFPDSVGVGLSIVYCLLSRYCLLFLSMSVAYCLLLSVPLPLPPGLLARVFARRCCQGGNVKMYLWFLCTVGVADDVPVNSQKKAVRCGAVRCGAVRCVAVRCDAVRCDAVCFEPRR